VSDSAPSSGSARRHSREIVIYHVGGEDGYGPLECILERMKSNVRLVIFEVRDDTSDAADVQHRVKDGMPVSIVRKGIDETRGTSDFHINKWPLSSSLLPVSPLAANEDPTYSHVYEWGENAALDRIIRVDTISIDELVAQGTVPPPDVISIDAQGAELRILRGAIKTLADHVSCVITEVEFHEIYRGQGLFDEQMQHLGKKGFRLFQILNQQHWHPGPRAGTGFLTVGEAVFFQCVKDIAQDDRSCVAAGRLDEHHMLRLAAIAMSFGAHSYAAQLMSFIRARSPSLFASLRSDAEYRRLVELCELLEQNAANYRANKDFFFQRLEVGKDGFSLKPPSERKSFPQRLLNR
jgi:FkbM family methyltransferase